MSDRNRIRAKRRAYKLASFDIRKHTPRERTPEELDRIAAAKARQEKERAEARANAIAVAVRTPIRAGIAARMLGFGLLGAMQRGHSRRGR